MWFILLKLVNQFFHRISKSSGTGLSQLIFICHDNWIICLGSIIVRVRIPNGSKIELTELSKLRFVIVISFCIVLSFSRPFSMSHRIPNVLCIEVFCKSKSTTACFWETPYRNSSFKIFGLLEINLVSLNPPDERVLMTSMHVFIALSLKTNQDNRPCKNFRV